MYIDLLTVSSRSVLSALYFSYFWLPEILDKYMHVYMCVCVCVSLQ